MTDVMIPQGDLLPTILSLLVKQQRLSESTSRLVESMVSDVGKFREQSERLAIVANKLDHLERATGDYDRKRSECLQQLSERFQQMESKREQNKDRIMALEQALHTQLNSLRGEIHEKIMAQEKEASRIREQIGYMAGKYGAVVSGAVSISLLLLKWLFDHHNTLAK